jgi:four helix bundle protein
MTISTVHADLKNQDYLAWRRFLREGEGWSRDQIRWAVVSIMSNIAEGFESRTQALFVEFLGRAKGSAGELRSQAYVALDAGYITQSQFEEVFNLAEKCSHQISRFMSYLLDRYGHRQVGEKRTENATKTFKR